MMMIAACMLSVVSVAQTTESLSIADFEITAGETKSVAVEMTSDTEFVAFQFDLLLPDGITIALTERGKLDVELGKDMVDDHTLAAQKVSETENRYRFVCFSMTNAGFWDTSGTVLNISIQADAELPAGQLAGILEKIYFTERSEVQHDFADATFTITCKESTSTGIGGMATGTQEQQVYTLDGRQTNATQKGVNIVRQSDGTVQKVYVK